MSAHRPGLTLVTLAALLVLMTSACESPNKVEPVPASTPAEEVAAEETSPALEEIEEKEADHAQMEAPPLGIGSTPEDIAPGASHVYGSPFTIIEPPVRLDRAIELAGTQGTGPYKVETQVEKVCQKKGCWFMLKSDGVKIPIRVTMKDYAFFVPRNATGLPVVVEGTFEKVTVSQEEAQHYADDEAAETGEPARRVEGPEPSWSFIATSVQIDRPEQG